MSALCCCGSVCLCASVLARVASRLCLPVLSVARVGKRYALRNVLVNRYVEENMVFSCGLVEGNERCSILWKRPGLAAFGVLRGWRGAFASFAKYIYELLSMVFRA